MDLIQTILPNVPEACALLLFCKFFFIILLIFDGITCYYICVSSMTFQCSLISSVDYGCNV